MGNCFIRQWNDPGTWTNPLQFQMGFINCSWPTKPEKDAIDFLLKIYFINTSIVSYYFHGRFLKTYREISISWNVPGFWSLLKRRQIPGNSAWKCPVWDGEIHQQKCRGNPCWRSSEATSCVERLVSRWKNQPTNSALKRDRIEETRWFTTVFKISFFVLSGWSVLCVRSCCHLWLQGIYSPVIFYAENMVKRSPFDEHIFFHLDGLSTIN